MVQIAVIGVCAVAFAVILFTSVLKKDDTSAPATTTATPAATASTTAAPSSDPAAASSSSATPAPSGSAATPAPVSPDTSAVTPPAAGGSPADGLLPSKGLPENLLVAFAKNQTIALLVVDPKGLARQAARAVHRHPPGPRRRRALRRQRPRHRQVRSRHRGRLGQPHPGSRRHPPPQAHRLGPDRDRLLRLPRPAQRQPGGRRRPLQGQAGPLLPVGPNRGRSRPPGARPALPFRPWIRLPSRPISTTTRGAASPFPALPGGRPAAPPVAI